MKKSLILSLVFVNELAFSGEDTEEWNYQDKGPAYWEDHFDLCGNGKEQSPININYENIYELEAGEFFGQGKELEFYPPPALVNVVNNHHSIQLNFINNYSIEYMKKQYKLQQLHFHHLSETTINGEHYPLEAHFVLANASDSKLVVAVLLEGEGVINKLLPYFKLTDDKPYNEPVRSFFEASSILPFDRDYVTFKGSLTTPPCSEGVQWFVYKYPAVVSTEEIEYFANHEYSANFRYVMPLNARKVFDFK